MVRVALDANSTALRPPSLVTLTDSGVTFSELMNMSPGILLELLGIIRSLSAGIANLVG
jgi:hypothetical protein